jgi:hypothetical protein
VERGDIRFGQFQLRPQFLVFQGELVDSPDQGGDVLPDLGSDRDTCQRGNEMILKP